MHDENVNVSSRYIGAFSHRPHIPIYGGIIYEICFTVHSVTNLAPFLYKKYITLPEFFL